MAKLARLPGDCVFGPMTPEDASELQGVNEIDTNRNVSPGKITDETVEGAVNYLASTDEPHARARAEYNALSELRKTVRAFCFGEQTGGVKEREMAAECHKDYIAHIEKIKQAEIEFHSMHNKRKRAELTIELYRTYSANVRRGNI